MSNHDRQSFTLHNQTGMRVSVTNYEAIITGIWVADRLGNYANVVLNYPDLTAYTDDPYYIGCVVGRFANRIDQGRLSVDGEVVTLSLNEPALMNHLHGGFEGFNKKTWCVVEPVDADPTTLYLTYTSPHGEENYPGTLAVTIRYHLTDRNELIVDYSAQTDQPTVVNLTNHSYFNLSGGGQDVRQHTLLVTASDYTPLNERYLPAEPVRSVAGTPFDLRQATELHDVFGVAATFNYCLDPSPGLTHTATLQESGSGRRLRVFTTAPGLQVYSGQYLGPPFSPFAGVCLEPQCYPDTPNHPDFPPAWLEPGAVYQQTTVYQFDVV